MAKNLGREFATMTEDERRRFALERSQGTDEARAELEFDDPRDGSGGRAPRSDAEGEPEVEGGG
ncbi:MAG TPA: hypothetical protein VH763_10700 [Gemmatimonadales bacterium]|jgi:hypothetical protein